MFLLDSKASWTTTQKLGNCREGNKNKLFFDFGVKDGPNGLVLAETPAQHT